MLPSIEPSSLPATLHDCTVRAANAQDAEALFKLADAADRAIVGTSLVSLADVVASLTAPSAVAGQRHRVVEQAGQIIAWTSVEEFHPDHFGVDVQVRPEHEATAALTQWALQWGDSIADAALAQSAIDRLQLGTWSYAEDTARAALYVEAGYDPARTFYRMSRVLDPHERFAAPAAGVTIRVAQIDVANPDAGEAPLVHEIISAAFADHFNYTPAPFERWWARRRDESGFDPTLWFLAFLDGKPVGATLLGRELEQAENAGYVHFIGTLREGRGHGVATSLLQHGFSLSRDEGRSHVKLFVDADSPTRATALYQSQGMTTERVTTDWQKYLPA